MYTLHILNDCLTLKHTAHNIEEVVILRAPSLLTDYSFQQDIANSDQWVLFCLADTGNVYCVVNQQVHNNSSDSSGDKNNPENQEIFTDLLEPKTNDVECTEFTVPVYTLKSCNILYKVGGRPLSMCSHEDILILLTEDTEGRYAFTVLRFQLGEIRPTVTAQTHTIHFNKLGNNLSGKSSLLKVVTADLIEDGNVRAESTDAVHIDNDLFKRLFGYSTALVNAPVLLFCPPEGSVYSIPLNVLFSISSDRQALLEIKAATDTSNSWKLFCETSSVVVDIVTMSVPYQAAAGDSYSDIEADKHVLLVCCSKGNIITYHYEPTNSKHEAVSQFVVTGPVLGADTYYNRFYHSTVSHLYETSLELVNPVEPRQVTTQNKVINITKLKTRKQSKINKIQVEPINTCTESREAPCMLHCIQRDGSYKCLDSSAVFDNKRDSPSDKLHIKDVLVAIDKTDTDHQQLTEEVKACDHLLEQISIASFLLYNRDVWDLNVRNIVTDRTRKQPFDYKFKVVVDSLHRAEGQAHIDLLCEITNQMPRHLSTDWSLEITAMPIGADSGAQRSHTTTVLPLVNGFKMKETASMVVTIQHDLVGIGFDLVVSLNLNTGLYMYSQVKDTCLSMPVYCERFDVLNFLVPKQGSLKRVRSLNTKEKMWREIEVLAHEHPSANCFIPGMERSDPESKSTVSLTKRLQFTYQQFQLLKDTYGQGTVDPACIFNWLLKDSSLPPRDIMRNKCQVMTLTGCDLYLEVKEVQNPTSIASLDDSSRERTLVMLNIQSDLSTAAAVSMAIDRKVKVLDIHNSGFPTSAVALNKFCHDLQTLEVDIQALSNKKLADKEKRKEIGNLYQRLRTVTLRNMD